MISKLLSCSLAISLAVICPAFGLDGIRISGTAEKLKLELDNAPVSDALAALGSAFDVKYRCAPHPNRRVTGTYQGTVRRVVTRLLDGFDFVIKTSPTGAVEVIALDTCASSGAAMASLQPMQSPAATLGDVDAVSVGIGRILQQQQPVR